MSSSGGGANAATSAAAFAEVYAASTVSAVSSGVGVGGRETSEAEEAAA